MPFVEGSARDSQADLSHTFISTFGFCAQWWCISDWTSNNRNREGFE